MSLLKDLDQNSLKNENLDQNSLEGNFGTVAISQKGSIGSKYEHFRLQICVFEIFAFNFLCFHILTETKNCDPCKQIRVITRVSHDISKQGTN